MAIMKKKQKSGYTHVDNGVFKSGLSLKARGLLCTMLSLPENWEFSENGLQQILNDGQTAIRTAIKELEEHGYLSRERERNEHGQMTACVWVVSDYPRLENHNLDNPNLVNRPQCIKKESITKESNTKKDMGKKRKRFIPPTLDEVSSYCSERENNVSPQRFIDFYSSKGWYVGKNKMKDWKASVRTWEQRDSKNSKPEYKADEGEWDF